MVIGGSRRRCAAIVDRRYPSRGSAVGRAPSSVSALRVPLKEGPGCRTSSSSSAATYPSSRSSGSRVGRHGDYDGLASSLVIALGASIPLRAHDPPISKGCSRCGHHLALDAFNTEQRHRDGRRSECRACQRCGRSHASQFACTRPCAPRELRPGSFGLQYRSLLCPATPPVASHSLVPSRCLKRVRLGCAQ